MKPMNRRKFVKTLGLGAGAPAASSLLAVSRARAAFAPAALGVARPNILCIVRDDYGY
jgi:phosphodiesterase/alkaline phosphatase D-like protein